MRAFDAKANWQGVHATYRKLMYESGEAKGSRAEGGPSKPGFSRDEVERVIAAGGKLSVHQALRCRVRYFSDGMILGSRAYIDEAFLRYRDRFGHKRSSGARPMKGTAWDDLFTARRLQLSPISVPAR